VSELKISQYDDLQELEILYNAYEITFQPVPLAPVKKSTNKILNNDVYSTQ
jgi:hypothetical protein